MYDENTNWAINPKTNFILSFWIKKKSVPDWSAFLRSNCIFYIVKIVHSYIDIYTYTSHSVILI